jgi:hypothetical protein
VLDFDPASLGVKALMREIRGKDKRMIAGLPDGIAEASIIAIETDEDIA